MERAVQRPLRPPVPGDPLITPTRIGPVDGPGGAARGEARVGLYVHVPFCAARCTYCDFSSGALSSGAVERWFAALEREVERRAPSAEGVSFTSVFFGGGTPSALSGRHFRRLWALLADHFAIRPGAEITLEANPESVKESLLEAWAGAGVNRLSMGAQSFDSHELRVLGRIHGAHRPAEAFALARAAGFRRLSLDLMFGTPGHGLASWRTTIDRALELEPEHLSAYCFIPEAGTPLGDGARSGALALPTGDEQAEMYAVLTERLARAGFSPYETSNFCRPGAESRHNLTYWLRRDTLGLGPSAHGLWRGERYGNRYALGAWADALLSGGDPEGERERSTAASIADEHVMLGLRLATGLVFADLPAGERESLDERYGAAFAAAIACGRLESTPNGVRIPPAHRFVADDTIAWIAARAVDTLSNAFLEYASCPIRRSPAA